MRADKQYRLFNGALECQLRNYQIALDAVASQKEVAQDFANRLRKNLKTLEKWASKENLDCYRLYDADLPEYNAAIDRYQDYLVVQEYAAPKDIPAQKTRQRLLDMVQAAIKVTGMDGEKVILKVRERQEGKQQYQKLSEEQHRMEVQEYGARLWVNLYDYLDTGLFLDHRQTRRMLGQMAKGKRFLNLFAYTGSATVHAGLGGARETTTVDMSRTYLNWAQDNMRLNSLVGREHKFVQADCLKWLSEADEQYDLIFIDPPTFSNSKRMDESFDVQRDHLLLMQHLKRLLAADGTLVFSTTNATSRWTWPALTPSVSRRRTSRTRPGPRTSSATSISTTAGSSPTPRHKADADPVSHRRLPPVRTGVDAGGTGRDGRADPPLRHPGGGGLARGLPGAHPGAARQCRPGAGLALHPGELQGWLAQG